DLPGHALDEDDGEEHRDGGEGRGNDGAAHLLGATDRGLAGTVAFFATAVDALEHHDGVVDEHANAQGEPTEAHDVEGDIGEVERGKRDHEADGDRQP